VRLTTSAVDTGTVRWRPCGPLRPRQSGRHDHAQHVPSGVFIGPELPQMGSRPGLHNYYPYHPLSQVAESMLTGSPFHETTPQCPLPSLYNQRTPPPTLAAERAPQ